jgi:hypothetical protein
MAFTDFFVEGSLADVQAGINSAVSTGKRLLLPPGTASISSTLSVDQAKGLVIEGSGVGEEYSPGGNMTRLQAHASLTTALLNVHRSFNITLRNLVLDLNEKTFPALLQSSLTTSGSKGLILENVIIRNTNLSVPAGIGIQLAGSSAELNNSENHFSNVTLLGLDQGVLVNAGQALNHNFYGLHAYYTNEVFRVAGGGSVNVWGGSAGHVNTWLKMPWTVNLGYNATHLLFKGIRAETSGVSTATNMFSWIESDGYTGVTVNFEDIREADGSGYDLGVLPDKWAFDVGGETVVNVNRAYLRGNNAGSGAWPKLFKVTGNASVTLDDVMSGPDPLSNGSTYVQTPARLIYKSRPRNIYGKEWPMLTR